VDLPGDSVDLLGLHVAREGPLGGAAASGQQGEWGGRTPKARRLGAGTASSTARRDLRHLSITTSAAGKDCRGTSMIEASASITGEGTYSMHMNTLA
jgi:hypothetical protein